MPHGLGRSSIHPSRWKSLDKLYPLPGVENNPSLAMNFSLKKALTPYRARPQKMASQSLHLAT